MAETKLEETKSQLQRARAYIQNMRSSNEQIVGRVTSGAMTVGGGVLAAIVDAKMPHLPGTNFPTKVALGALAAGVGCVDGAGKFSDQLASLGFGLLAVEANQTTSKALAAA